MKWRNISEEEVLSVMNEPDNSEASIVKHQSKEELISIKESGKDI